MEQRKRMNLALGSYLRLQLGWRKDKTEAERDRIAKEAQRLADDANSTDNVIIGTRLAREPFEALEKAATKEMSPAPRCSGGNARTGPRSRSRLA